MAQPGAASWQSDNGRESGFPQEYSLRAIAGTGSLTGDGSISLSPPSILIDSSDYSLNALAAHKAAHTHMTSTTAATYNHSASDSISGTSQSAVEEDPIPAPHVPPATATAAPAAAPAHLLPVYPVQEQYKPHSPAVQQPTSQLTDMQPVWHWHVNPLSFDGQGVPDVNITTTTTNNNNNNNNNAAAILQPMPMRTLRLPAAPGISSPRLKVPGLDLRHVQAWNSRLGLLNQTPGKSPLPSPGFLPSPGGVLMTSGTAFTPRSKATTRRNTREIAETLKEVTKEPATKPWCVGGMPTLTDTGCKQATTWQKNKLMLLPVQSNQEAEIAALASPHSHTTTSIKDLQASQEPSTCMINIFCIAEYLDLSVLADALSSAYPSCPIHAYADSTHVELRTSKSAVHLRNSSGASATEDVFFFECGVVCCWGLPHMQEQGTVVNIGRKSAVDPLDKAHTDQFEVIYTSNEAASIQNDTIIISSQQANNHQLKLAICFALAQSSKLCVYEKRVMATALKAKGLPGQLAREGKVAASATAVAQLTGQVFQQQTDVNLLSSVLETPEFFWSAPDQLQLVYTAVCQYLEIEDRLEVLNGRFGVLQNMLALVSESQEHLSRAQLEWVVIVLIAIGLAIAVFDIVWLFKGHI
eukprot:jgi/Chrzof1/1595/Cz10g13230.t1